MLKKDSALDYTFTSYLMSKQENEAQTKNKTEENEIKSISFCISCGGKFTKKYSFCPSCGSCKITSY
jgi:rRNA maturation endonuclease Nob1